MKRFFVAVCITLSTLSMSACGYQLRGFNQATATQTIQVSWDNTVSGELKSALNTQLQAVGFKPNHSTFETADIALSNVQLQRHKLVGILTEVRLVLSADVYHKQNNKQKQTLRLTRSYQYNEAGVTTADGESARVQSWLYQDLAKQIADQQYAFSQHLINPSQALQ